MNKNIFATLKIFLFVCVMLLGAPQASASDIYPQTLDNGNLVLVDAKQGVGRYAERSSVKVARYAPPNYQISIRVITVSFSEDYWRSHHTYIGGPYSKTSSQVWQFRYNWNRKSIAYFGNGSWINYDIYRDHSAAEGNPLIPYTAEAAFVSAYNIRFFGNTRGYGNYRVIDEDFYGRLNV